MNEHLDQNIYKDSRRGATALERHLILVRAIWWIVALLVFGFIAVGVPDRYAQLSTISPGANTLAGQLRPDEAYALEQAGIPVTFYAIYFTALYTLFTLLFASTGLALAWLRPKDRVALLISLSLIGMGLTAITVGMTQPRWHLAFMAVRAVWYASSIPALYLFPDGRFVPRWTRWLTAIWLIYTVVWLIFPAISPPFGFGQGFTGSELPRNLWILLWICSGLAAQIYRYRHVSNAMQRQQIKWVEFGFGSFVILWIIGISTITLTQLAPMGGTMMIAKLAGTSIVLLGELIAPLSLVASILRYQLFGIDILINRTLVYGTLTASVAGLYVLIVGGLGALLQMQNNLPGIVIAILLIAFLFQPLRRRLQNFVDRFVPVPKATIHESIPSPVPQIKQEKKGVAVGGESKTMLRGRWLILARLAWIVVFSVLTAMYALGFQSVRDTLSTVCQEERCTLRQQIQYTDAGDKVLNWPGPTVGYADRLRPDQVEALEMLGLTLDQYGWLAALQMGFPALVLLLIGAGLFWWKSDDWMVLFSSIMVATFPLHNMPLPFDLMVHQPAWEWVYHAAGVVAFSCLMIFPLIFPNGQFVPRWTRWMALYGIAGAFIGTFLGSTILEVLGDFAGKVFIGLGFLLPSFGTGVFAQLYRYFRVARPADRQQIKLVVMGVVGLVVIQFAVLIPLNALLTSPGVRADLAKALVLSAIPDTLWQVNLLLLPVCITISVLRYRLWDIDIFINRSLVYGALTASVVSLYVLIVGWLSIGLQTNNLPASVFAILIITFLFRPLRQRLQGIADRFVPVPQSPPSSEQSGDRLTIPEGAGSILRHNRAALAILPIAFLLLTLGAAFVLMRLITPYDDARLQPGTKDIWYSNGIVISPLNRHTNGLQRGDLVVAVNGCSLESFAQALFDPSAPRPQWNGAQTLIYTVLRDGRTLDVAVTPTRYPLSAIFAEEWGGIVFAISFLLITGFVFFKRPDETAARVLFLGAAGSASAITWSFGLQVSDIVGAVGWWLYLATTTVGYLVIFIAMLHLALVFPQPHPIILRWRWLIPLIYLAPYAILLATMLVARMTAVSALEWLATVDSAAGSIQLVCVMLTIIVNAHNYASLRDPISRRQLRWVLFAVSVAGIAGIVFGYIPELVIGHTLLSWNELGLFGLLIPLALAFAILRYRLFDIDIIINRTLVYGALTAVVVGIYVVVVGYLGVLFQTGNSLAISLIATGLVAVVFQPLRQRLQRGINRLMYGERDDPYAALSRLGRRLEASLAPEAVLPTVVTTVREVLKLPYVAIYLHQNSHGYKIVAESASPSLRPEGGKIRVPGMEREGRCIPLIHQGETLGYIVLGPRAPNEAFSPTDLRLLEDLAPQVGVAVHAVRLTADLQRSREQLVLAREEERRRLRRDLHDGLGPQLAGLTLKLETARNRLTDDPLTDSLLADLAKHTQEATADIRRLVYELRPPTLDELGLVSALRESASQYSQQGHNSVYITIDAPENLPALPAAVEVAVYRIAQEALTNVLRHAEAQACKVSLKLDEQMNLICLEIQDDGRGLSSTRRAGIGLSSMRERAEELGGTWIIESMPTGGTRILVRLPYRLPDEPASTLPEEA